MSKNPSIRPRLWDIPISRQPRPEEQQWARDRLIGALGRERLEQVSISASSVDEAIGTLRPIYNHSGGGCAPGRIGRAARRYGYYPDGLDAWFGDEPEKWLLRGYWTGWSADPDRLYLMQLIYVLDDVPPEKVRRIRVTLRDVVGSIRERHVQPSLLEAS